MSVGNPSHSRSTSRCLSRCAVDETTRAVAGVKVPTAALLAAARCRELSSGILSDSLVDVVALARTSTKSFGEDPRGGPWVAVLRHDEKFASAYAALNPEHYKFTLSATARALFDRDTAPGAEPEAMLKLAIPALVVPGKDASHATSAARYLEECLPASRYWDAAPDAQTAQSTPAKLLEFLASCP